MLPTAQQYQKWSLWTSLIAILAGIISFVQPLLLTSSTERVERSKLLLQVAHELRYNHEWLSQFAVAYQSRTSMMPSGTLKTDALITLMNRDHGLVVKEAYGEEKYIYQHVMLLKDAGIKLGVTQSISEVTKLNINSLHTLHDIHFLNNFLFWYLRPLINETLDEQQLLSIGRQDFPTDVFVIKKVPVLNMKFFLYEKKPITAYIDYLGLID